MEPGVSGVAWLPMPPGKENCFEEALHPRFVLTLIRVDLRARPLEVSLRENCWSAVPRTREEDCIKAILVDQSVEVLKVQHPEAKIEAGPPVSIDLPQLFAAEWCSVAPLDRHLHGFAL